MEIGELVFDDIEDDAVLLCCEYGQTWITRHDAKAIIQHLTEQFGLDKSINFEEYLVIRDEEFAWKRVLVQQNDT